MRWTQPPLHDLREGTSLAQSLSVQILSESLTKPWVYINIHVGATPIF